MSSDYGELVFINAGSHPELGLKIANRLDVEPLNFKLGTFPNQEQKVRRVGDVSGKDVCIFSSLHARYDTIRELRLICNTIQNAGRLFGIFPFVRDGKSDHTKRFGEAVAYKVTADDISSSGIELAAIFDQHSSQHPMAFDTMHYRLRHVHHLYMMRLCIEYARDKLKYDGIIGLDDGSFKRNKIIAEILKCEDVSFIIKYRDPETREVSLEKSFIVGDVKDKDIISFDDFIQGGGTTKVGAQIAKMEGAKSFTSLAVHNDFHDGTFDTLNPLLIDGTIDKLIIIDSLPLIRQGEWHENLIVLTPDKFLARVIDHIHYKKHMRGLFLGIS